MKKFQRIKQELELNERLVYSVRGPLSEEHRKALLSDTSILPQDYVDFLLAFGFGDFGMLTLFGGPVQPTSLLPSLSRNADHFLLIGEEDEDFYLAFDPTNQNQLVLLDFDMGIMEAPRMPFEDYVLQHLIRCNASFHE